jgi:16S rRNA G1207 methylase RsmC
VNPATTWVPRSARLQPGGKVRGVTDHGLSCEARMKARLVKKCGVAAKHDGYDIFGRRKGFLLDG